MKVSKEEFFSIQSKMDFISYDQSKGFHDFKSKNSILYFIDNADNPRICVWGEFIIKYKFITLLRINGESFNYNVTRKDYKNFYSQIINENKEIRIINIVNNNPYSVNFELGIRLAGFIRPMAFFDSPLSILVELEKENIRSRQWRRQLKEAINNDLKFLYVENPTHNDVSLFVRMYNELAQRKSLGSSINEINIMNLLSDDKYELFFVLKDDEYLAGRIVYLHNNTSYDVYAANSNKSKEIKGVTYFMMESIFEFLKANGVKIFDFGRIGVGKRSSNSVYEFKSYSGGKIINYNSAWEYSNSKFLNILLSIFKSLKSNRY